METDPTPDPIQVRVDTQDHPGITSVIVEEGVLTLVDTNGWVISHAPGSWSRAYRVDPTDPPDVPWGDPRNLS